MPYCCIQVVLSPNAFIFEVELTTLKPLKTMKFRYAGDKPFYSTFRIRFSENLILVVKRFNPGTFIYSENIFFIVSSP